MSVRCLAVLSPHARDALARLGAVQHAAAADPRLPELETTFGGLVVGPLRVGTARPASVSRWPDALWHVGEDIHNGATCELYADARGRVIVDQDLENAWLAAETWCGYIERRLYELEMERIARVHHDTLAGERVAAALGARFVAEASDVGAGVWAGEACVVFEYRNDIRKGTWVFAASDGVRRAASAELAR